MLREVMIGAIATPLCALLCGKVYDRANGKHTSIMSLKFPRQTWMRYILTNLAAVWLMCTYISAVEILSSCIFHPNVGVSLPASQLGLSSEASQPRYRAG
jgi:hypothetical protein